MSRATERRALIETLSPYVGKALAMHLWLAENCTEDGLITPDRRTLAKAAGANVGYVTVWLWAAVEDGWLEAVVDRRGINKGRSTFRVMDPRAALAG